MYGVKKEKKVKKGEKKTGAKKKATKPATFVLKKENIKGGVVIRITQRKRKKTKKAKKK
jgi:hypothetical protein